MKGYFDISGLKNCKVTFCFSHNVITDNLLDFEKLKADGFDCSISITPDCTGLSVFQSVTVLGPYLWIETSDIRFNLQNVKCNREIEVTYSYTWYQWITRFAVLAYRKLLSWSK